MQQIGNSRHSAASRLLRRFGEVLVSICETHQWIPVLLDYIGVRRLAYPYELVLRTGERLTLREHMDTVVFWLIFVRRHYPVDSSYAVILDIGANIGMFTLYAAREALNARVIAIEPFPETCEKLQEHVETNHLKHRVTIVNCAVTGKAGGATMDSAKRIPSQYRRIHAPETATLNAAHRGSAGAQHDQDGVSVRTQTLEEVLDQCGVGTADFVKMNIHGSEYDVLLSTGADVLKRCRTIAVQYHTLPKEMKTGKQEIFDHLKGSGFGLLFDNDTHRGTGCALLASSTDKVVQGTTKGVASGCQEASAATAGRFGRSR